MKFQKCISGNDSYLLYLDKTKQNQTPKQKIPFLRAVSFQTNNMGLEDILTAEEALLCFQQAGTRQPPTGACFATAPPIWKHNSSSQPFKLRWAIWNVSLSEYQSLVFLFTNYLNHFDGRWIVLRKYKSESATAWIADQNSGVYQLSKVVTPGKFMCFPELRHQEQATEETEESG